MGNVREFLVLLFLASGTARPRVKRAVPSLYTVDTTNVTWYDDAPGYPEQGAERLLDEMRFQNKTRYVLNSEQLSKVSKLKMAKHKNITYENLCPSEKRMIFPKRVKFDMEEYFVLNPRSRQFQFIETEVCAFTSKDSNQNERCNLIDDAGFDYETKCKQEYITRIIHLLSNNSPRKVITSSIKIASCCSCFVYY